MSVALERTWRVETSVEPTSEPVTLAQAKSHLRVDDVASDSYIIDLIKAARQSVEARIDSTLMTTTKIMRLSRFDGNDANTIKLFGSPIQSITSVKYYDTDNVLQTWSSTNWVENFGGVEHGIIQLADGASWPSITARLDAVEITYIAGYTSAGNVPNPIKQAILSIVGTLFLQREDAAVSGSYIEIPAVADCLLFNYQNFYRDPWQ